ncbi:hypothetical protein CEXT_158101 [Caerostris extrusa]|uniref:Uncharacterized protein n=1 Tax=Caerostris extrusa TaxID=172846 RepID=A0AAV4XZ04_CAEEX|nr:hypothetical protein CEXT_158101 [Caerostris extrusa]
MQLELSLKSIIHIYSLRTFILAPNSEQAKKKIPESSSSPRALAPMLGVFMENNLSCWRKASSSKIFWYRPPIVNPHYQSVHSLRTAKAFPYHDASAEDAERILSHRHT